MGLQRDENGKIYRSRRLSNLPSQRPVLKKLDNMKRDSSYSSPKRRYRSLTEIMNSYEDFINHSFIGVAKPVESNKDKVYSMHKSLQLDSESDSDDSSSSSGSESGDENDSDNEEGSDTEEGKSGKGLSMPVRKSAKGSKYSFIPKEKLASNFRLRRRRSSATNDSLFV